MGLDLERGPRRCRVAARAARVAAALQPQHHNRELAALLYRRIREAGGQTYARWWARWELIHGRPGRKRAPDTAALAARYRLPPDDLDLPALLYALECCFVLELRARAYGALAQVAGAPQPHGDPAAAAGLLLSPAPFAALGVSGFDGGDLFDVTPLLAAEPERALLGRALRATLARPGGAGPHADDRLRQAYHQLLPKQLRHGLGAYYTPPWLAEHVVATVWEHLPPETGAPRTIDPACGSGVFLTAAARRLAGACRARGLAGAPLAAAVLGGVAGLDINPLAVQAARANLALLLADLLAEERAALDAPLALPVALGDALTDPAPAAPFDAVVGNPPWVNWEYLPPAYRAATSHLWVELGLFGLRGVEKAFSKEDIAGLFTFAACRQFLGDGGLLGFVLPQSLLKSSVNGRGFRRMRLGPEATPLQVLQVDDMVALRPFEGAGSRPAAVFLRKGAATSYPVPYRRWSPAGGRAAIPESAGWDEVRRTSRAEPGSAAPVDPSDPGSPWADGPAALTRLPQLSGASPYQARSGMFTGGANAVFYLELLEALPGGLLRVRNIVERARRSVPAVEAVLEAAHVYPLLRGRELGSWRHHGSSLVLCPHTAASRMEAVPPEQLAAAAPLTLAYLAQFRAALDERRGFVRWEQRFREAAFYACQRIGAYTFAPYKVAWRYIAATFQCAVVGPGAVPGRGEAPVVPHEKLMIIPFETAEEAHFACALLTSSPARLFVQSRMVETQIAPHVIQHLALPRYDAADPAHRAAATLCRQGHALLASGDAARAQEAAGAIDELLPRILPLAAADVRAARAATGPLL